MNLLHSSDASTIQGKEPSKRDKLNSNGSVTNGLSCCHWACSVSRAIRLHSRWGMPGGFLPPRRQQRCGMQCRLGLLISQNGIKLAIIVCVPHRC